MQRPIRPPPKVIPKVTGATNYPPSPMKSIPSQKETHVDDFEAQVRAEMSRMEAQLKQQLGTEASPPRPVKEQPQQQHRVQSFQSPPKFNPSFEPSEHNNTALDFNHPSFDSAPSSNVRKKGGAINNLHGPPDDRLNMKAAKAAAYAKELEDQMAVNRQYQERGRLNDRNTHEPSDERNRPSGGMMFGLKEDDEKHRKRLKQQEYREQLNAQKADKSPPPRNVNNLDGQRYLQKGRQGDDGASALHEMYSKPDGKQNRGSHADNHAEFRKIYNPAEFMNQPPQQLHVQREPPQFSSLDAQYYHHHNPREQHKHFYQEMQNNYEIAPDERLRKYDSSPTHEHSQVYEQRHPQYPNKDFRQGQQNYTQKSQQQQVQQDYDGQYAQKYNDFQQQPNHPPQHNFHHHSSQPRNNISLEDEGRARYQVQSGLRSMNKGNMYAESRETDKNQKRQQQAEYRRLLEIQMKEDEARKQKEKELLERGNGIRMGSDEQAQEQQEPTRQQRKPVDQYYDNMEEQNQVYSLNQDGMAQAPSSQPNYRVDIAVNKPPHISYHQESRLDQQIDGKARVTKGNCTGKVSQLSNENDKEGKRARQVEYRRMLELQMEEDKARKKEVEKYWKNESRPSSPDQCGGVNKNSLQVPLRPNDRDDQDDNAIDSQLGQISPTKSPSKARNRLVGDVYGGGNFMQNGQDDLSRGWKPSKGDTVNEKHLQAKLEQKAMLEAQIEAVRKRKEEEAKKEKEEDEMAEKRARAAYESPRREKMKEAQADKDRSRQIQEAAHEVALAKMNQMKSQGDTTASGEVSKVESEMQDLDTPRDEDYDNFHGSPLPTGRSQLPSNRHSRQSQQPSPGRSQHRQQPSMPQQRNISQGSAGRRHPHSGDFGPQSTQGSRRNSNQSSEQQQSPSRRQSHSTTQPKESLDFLKDLGMPHDNLIHSENYLHEPPQVYQQGIHRLATPGGHLESQSRKLPVSGVSRHSNGQPKVQSGYSVSQYSVQNRNSVERDDFAYREGVEQDDVFLVDWQHHNGYPTKQVVARGKPNAGVGSEEEMEASLISDSRFNIPNQNPWIAGGLLSDLSIDPTAKQSRPDLLHPSNNPHQEDESVMEKSMASESILTYLGRRTPNTSRQGNRNERFVMKRSESIHHLDMQEGGHQIDEDVPHSPLQSLIQESELSRLNTPKHQIDRLKVGNNRDSRDTLERLIGNSYHVVGDDLLLTSRTRESYEDKYSKQYIPDERPLTSAGKKDGREFRGNSGDMSDKETEGKDEVMILQSPDRSGIAGNYRQGLRDDLLRSDNSGNRTHDFIVNEVTIEEREMMRREQEDKDEEPPLRRSPSSASSVLSRKSSSRYSARRFDDDDDDGIDAPAPKDILSSSSNRNLQSGHLSAAKSRSSLGMEMQSSDALVAQGKENKTSRPQSKSSSRSDQKSVRSPNTPHHISSSGSSPYKSEFMRNHFDGRPLTGTSVKSGEHHSTHSRPQSTGSGNMNVPSSRPSSKHMHRENSGSDSRASAMSRQSALDDDRSRPGSVKSGEHPSTHSRPQSTGSGNMNVPSSRPSSKHMRRENSGSDSRASAMSRQSALDDDRSRPGSVKSGEHPSTHSRPQSTGSGNMNVPSSRPSSKHMHRENSGSDSRASAMSRQSALDDDRSRPGSVKSGEHPSTHSRPQSTGSGNMNVPSSRPSSKHMHRENSGSDSRASAMSRQSALDDDRSRPGSVKSGEHLSTHSRPQSTGSGNMNVPSSRPSSKHMRRENSGSDSRASAMSRQSALDDDRSRPGSVKSGEHPSTHSRPQSTGSGNMNVPSSRPSSKHMHRENSGSDSRASAMSRQSALDDDRSRPGSVKSGEHLSTHSRPQSTGSGNMNVSSSRPSSKHMHRENSGSDSRASAMSRQSALDDDRSRPGSVKSGEHLSSHSRPQSTGSGNMNVPSSRPSSKHSHDSSGDDASKHPSRKHTKSKWNTSSQAKAETTEALRKRSGNDVNVDGIASIDGDSLQDSLEMNDENIIDQGFHSSNLTSSDALKSLALGGENELSNYDNENYSNENGDYIYDENYYENQTQESQLQYAEEGFDQDGYDQYGYDQYGYDRYGFDQYGYDHYGYDKDGKLYEEKVDVDDMSDNM